MQRPFRVGRNCPAWCTKCKSETEHVIVAMVEQLPKRVECCSCGSQHNYRLPPGSAKQGPRRRSAGRSREVGASSWRAQVQDQEQAPRNYKISATFEEGDFLDHPRFGEGVVQKVVPGGKIEVLFEGGMHLLVHERN